MPAAKLRSAELQRPHLALMSLSGGGGAGGGARYSKHIQNTLGTQTQHAGQGKSILQMRKLRPYTLNQ